jgi:cytochrome c556
MRLTGLGWALGAGLALAVGLAAAPGALAVDKAQLLQERQDLMKKQGREWLVIRNYLQGEAEQAAALSAVEALQKSVPTVPDFFPPGSEGANPDGKWGPKPEVFSERDKFIAADKKVTEQVAALGAAIKSGDKAKTEVAFKELDICGACHKTFRAKLQ